MTFSSLNTNRLGGALAWGAFSNTSTGTYTASSIPYAYVTFTASGTLNVSRAGFFDFLCVAGGGGGGSGVAAGGGAGGMIDSTQSGGVPIYLTVGSHTITVGAASGIQGTGNDSAIGTAGLTACGGGPGNTYAIRGGSGGAAGGGAAGSGVLYQGTNGASNGGGAGSSASGLTHGQAGKASSIAGSTPTTSYTAGSFTFSAGGISAGGGNGTINTGMGGNGSNASGGSGIVIIRMRTP